MAEEADEEETPREEQEWERIYSAGSMDPERFCVRPTGHARHSVDPLRPDPWTRRLEQARPTEPEFQTLLPNSGGLHKRGRPRSIDHTPLFDSPYAHALDPDVYLIASDGSSLLDYEMDEQDGIWLCTLNNELMLREEQPLSADLFESIMDSFEKHFYHLVPFCTSL